MRSLPKSCRTQTLIHRVSKFPFLFGPKLLLPFCLLCLDTGSFLALAEYVDNLKDEGRVCGIIDRLLQYLESKGSTEEVCRIYLRRIMHTYYKFDYKAHRRSLGLQGETKVSPQ